MHTSTAIAADTSMENEVELNYRLTGHLQQNETVLSTLLSIHDGIYAATDRRILCVNSDRIGYRLRVHPYCDLERVECIEYDDASYVQFSSAGRQLTVRASSRKDARGFVDAVAAHITFPQAPLA
jgi:hypothetical protein